MHSTENNEFWSALLEKAYAKLHGSYEALKGGTTCEALEDFTGGVTEMYDLKEAPENIFRIIMKGFLRQSMMGCSMKPDPDVTEAVTPQGLVCGHAYSLTKAQMVDIATRNKSGKIPLIRLRNPWGNATEWNGAFSDKSREWQCIPELAKVEMGLTFSSDGEFWMTLKDFLTYFDEMEICNLTADCLVEEEGDETILKWNTIEGEGEWVKGKSAGGCRNFIDTFVKNPQFILTLDQPVGDLDGKCTVLVALMQKNRRNKQIPFLSIGFAIYRVNDDFATQMPFNEKFFNVRASTARSKNFQNSREVTARFKLPGGKYLIIPSTFNPGEEGEFLLRVFSETPNSLIKIK
jgi:calpain, invertebrate